MTGLTSDGTELVRATLTNASGPLLAINAGRTATDRSEQSGFANLVIGVVGLCRNPTAHDPKSSRAVSDEELVEALTAMSMVHRRLDDASVNRSPVIRSSAARAHQSTRRWAQTGPP